MSLQRELRFFPLPLFLSLSGKCNLNASRKLPFLQLSLSMLLLAFDGRNKYAASPRTLRIHNFRKYIVMELAAPLSALGRARECSSPGIFPRARETKRNIARRDLRARKLQVSVPVSCSASTARRIQLENRADDLIYSALGAAYKRSKPFTVRKKKRATISPAASLSLFARDALLSRYGKSDCAARMLYRAGQETRAFRVGLRFSRFAPSKFPADDFRLSAAEDKVQEVQNNVLPRKSRCKARFSRDGTFVI